MKSLPRRRAAHTRSGLLWALSSGNTIRLENNSCKKSKRVFCIWCLFAKQWTPLLLKESIAQLSQKLHPSGLGKKVTGYERRKQEESCNCIFIPTWHLKSCWGISDQIDHKAIQKDPSNWKGTSFPLFRHRLYWDQQDCSEIFTPRNSFYQLRLGPIEMLRRVRETFSPRLEISSGGHTWQGFYLFLCATNPGFVFSL